jgi:hypothetical protein
MPRDEFERLPDEARIWIFASERELQHPESERLLAAVDAHLDGWLAHGVPLRSAREWRDSRFLVIAVDERATGASGCSIDGLYRQLRNIETELSTRLTAGGNVYYRDSDGGVRVVTRDQFTAASVTGSVDAATRVFDPALTSLGDYRTRFETDAGQSWHASLLETPAARR